MHTKNTPLKTSRKGPPLAVVRGVGDVGSAVIWNLFKAGFAVIAHENRQPRTIRRKMAFCDALWNGESELEGVFAKRVDRLEEVLPFADQRQKVALYSGSFEDMMKIMRPRVLVDARIQKFADILPSLELADLSIGVGPSFKAQEHVDVVIESCWGEQLGKIIEEGEALEPVNVPPELNGIGWDRFLRAPVAGRFESDLDIGDFVKKGDVIGYIDNQPMHASIDGHLRGLLHPGLSVLMNEKICEIDPRGKLAHFKGLAERPSVIADGVLEAITKILKRGALPAQLNILLDQGHIGLLGKKGKMS